MVLESQLPGLSSCLKKQCCGSVTFQYGSESADPYHRLTDPNPDLAIFVSDLQDSSKKILNLYLVVK